MEGPDDKPLLVLSREGEGRVALLLSDHIWLWARGFEGGGPHLDLLRRLSHWLMKQPDLEEEALRVAARGRDLTIERQTMAETVEPVIADDAVRRDPHRDAARRPSPACGAARRRQRTRAVARDRRQADDARQCRPGQSARIRRGHLDHRSAAAACRPRPAAMPAASTTAAASTCRASSACARARPSAATTGSG